MGKICFNFNPFLFTVSADQIDISERKDCFLVKKFVPDQWAEKNLKIDGDNGEK